MHLYLVRHPVTVAPKGSIYGQTDHAIADGALATALDSWDALLPHEAVVWSSPLVRCRNSAIAWCQRHNLPQPRLDARLMELNFGQWETRLWADIHPNELNPWMEDWINVAPPGGETVLDLQARLDAWLADAKAGPSALPVVVFGHSAPLRLLTAVHQGLAVRQMFDIKLDYAQVIQLEM